MMVILKFYRMTCNLEIQFMRLCALCLLYLRLLNACSSTTEKIVVDTDAGGDDAIAILMLLRAESLRKYTENFEIVGITCSYGNTREENVEQNVIKTLVIANRTDIPVYTGAKNALIEEFSTDNFFGKDGFGEMNVEHTSTKKINETPSAIALIEFSKLYSGNLSIIILGPSTNVALAIMLDEHFVNRVKTFHVSGSSIAGTVNIGPYPKHNFGADPESNFILLRSVNASQLTLFPWETGFNAGLSRNWRKKVLGNIESPYRTFINQVESISFKNVLFYVPNDIIAVAIFLDPKLIIYSLIASVRSELEGKNRGAIFVKYERPNTTNARIILSINQEAFKLTLLHCLNFNYDRC